VRRCGKSETEQKASLTDSVCVFCGCLCVFMYVCDIFCIYKNKPLGVQASIFVACPSQDKLGGLQQEGHPS